MKKLKILIADDEVMLQEIYALTLESEFSCEFVCVSNGNEAIEALKTIGPFDLIMSDYRMPVANGGKIFLFNKTLHNTPFFLFSGGFLEDYAEFSDFYQVNPANQFFGKPFSEDQLISAVRNLKISKDQISPNEDQLIKVNLRHYLNYTCSAAEVYIRLHDDKFTKIIEANQENVPEKDLLQHYLDKGIETIYVSREHFNSFMRDIFKQLQDKIQSQKKQDSIITLGGLSFKVNLEGLKEIGITNFEIEKANDVIQKTVFDILDNEETKERFKQFCSLQGFGIGHSLLIMYIAACICHESGINFSSSMRKICTAAFFHDYSLFEIDATEDDLEITQASNHNILYNHPSHSAEFLPNNFDLVDDTKKIILEHHEKPNGNGYPKKLNAHNISPLSCLFILSQEITFNLIRNDFDKERLRDFIQYLQKDYSQGNFGKFFKASKSIFA